MDDDHDEFRTFTTTELKRRWALAYGVQPPTGLGRDLLSRGLRWWTQAQLHGNTPPALRRELARLARQIERSGDLDVERQLSLKVGTRLVREWRRATHHVTVLDEGFLYEDRRYASLTQIAREITGTKWSGPRFFGLRQRSRGKAGDDHA